MKNLLLLLLFPLICVADDAGSGHSEEEAEDDTMPVFWFFLISLFAILFYTSCVVATWPYARPIFPFWIFILFVFIPPAFPFLLFYLFITACFFTLPFYDTYPNPPVATVVVVEETPKKRATSNRGNRV